MTEWAFFSRSLICDFGPSIYRDTIGDLAPPRHVGTVNDYIDNFITYALHVGITSEPHQVNLFVTGLQHAFRTVVANHHPREMETAINLTRTLEHIPPTTADAE